MNARPLGSSLVASRALPPRIGPALIVLAVVLIVLGVAVAACAGRWSTDADRLRFTVLGYALSALGFVALAFAGPSLETLSLGSCRLLGLALRLTLLAAPALLSEDLYRYLWDGLAQAAGYDPYAWAPQDPRWAQALASSPELAALRPLIGHAQVPTIYPAAAQWAFRLSAALSLGPWGWRVLIVLVDLVGIFFFERAERRSGRVSRVARLWWLCPLALFEGAIGGHVDVLGAASLSALLSGGTLAVSMGLALACGLKFFPAVALLVAPRRVWLLFTLLTVVLWLPYWSSLASGSVFQGLSAYGQRWRGNEGLFALVAWPFERLWPAGGEPMILSEAGARAVRLLVGPATPWGGASTRIYPDELSFASAKGLCLIALAVWVVHSACRCKDLPTFLLWVTTGLLVVSPVVHPWYLLWLLPLTLHRAAAGFYAPIQTLALASFASVVAYLPRIGFLENGQWSTSPGVRALAYGLVALGLLRAARER